MIVACVLRSGGRFGVADVTRLRRGVRRHSHDAEFVVLTDVRNVMFRNAWTVPLATDLPGWWAKMELFRPGVFGEGRRVFYLDLDTVIVGDLSELLSYDGPMACLSDFYGPTNAASGVLAFPAELGVAREIWDDFSRDPVDVVRRHPRRMDHYLRRFLDRHDGRGAPADRLQDLYPGQLASYKADLRGRRPPYREIAIPDGARAVCFHGRPEPRDLDPDDPVRKEWER